MGAEIYEKIFVPLFVPFLTVCLCDRNETVVEWKQILRITDNGASFKLNQMCLCQL